MDATNRKIALLLFAKGSRLPEFLATLNAHDRKFALEVMNELHPIGPMLYACWLVKPAQFAASMGESERSRLELLAELARRQIALSAHEFDDILPPGFSVDTGDLSVITFDIEKLWGTLDHVEKSDEQEFLDILAPTATPTTNPETLQKIRSAGLAGLN